MNRKMASALLLAMLSGNVAAEWVAVGANDFSYTYVDPTTMFKAGDRVKMWHLVDFNAVQAKPTGQRYMSEKLQYEYDCKDKRARMLNALAQSRNMGGGVVVDGAWGQQNWEPVPPDSRLNHLWKFACGKR